MIEYWFFSSKYNAAGNLLQQVDPLSNTTNFEYDLLGRQIKTIDPLSNESETIYHATTGRVTSQKDAKGVSMTFTYNPLGQVLTTTDRVSKVTTNTYNNMGQIATVTDAESRTTAYGYNLLGARNSLTFSDTGVQTVNTFDGAGRPLEITSPSGRKQNLTYNFLGNVTQVQFKNSGGTVTETQAMTYDDYGRETATSSSQYSASTAKTYNDRGQLATESTTYSGQTYTVTYHYDAQGRPNKLTYPSGREAEYTYDDRQLLKTIKWETTQIEDRSYNDAGMLTGVDRAYVDETRTYNAGSQLTQIDNTSVGSQTYTYDLNGNVTSETLSGVMANYSFSTLHSGSPYADGYDAEDRFMRFKRSGVSEDILLTRSDIGNISNVNRNGTNIARGYNTSHGLTTVTGGTTQTYDTDGNTTKLHTNVTAAWDDAGRMKNTDVPAGATAGIVGLNENGYVGGTRIWKKITRKAGVEHRVHIHAGPNLIAEYNAGVAASTPVQEYVYAGEIDSLVLIRRSDSTKYGVTRNRQWSITALHDLANGNVVERYAYEMTGKRTIYAANGTTIRTTSSYGNNFGYTNRWHDEESGLMYFRARYYNPLTGEFLSRDPMEFVDGMSLYRGYFGLNSVDPTGRWVKVAVGVIASITIAVLQTMWSEMQNAGDYFGQDFFEGPLDIAGECGKDKNVPELPPCPEGAKELTWQGNTIAGMAFWGRYKYLDKKAQGKGKMTWEYRGNTIHNLQAFDNGTINDIGGTWETFMDTTSIVVFAKIIKRDKEYAPCACDCKTKGVAFVEYGTIAFRDHSWDAHQVEVCHGQVKIDGQGGATFIKEIACSKYNI